MSGEKFTFRVMYSPANRFPIVRIEDEVTGLYVSEELCDGLSHPYESYRFYEASVKADLTTKLRQKIKDQAEERLKP